MGDELYEEYQPKKQFPTDAARMYRIACTAGNGHACRRLVEFVEIDKKYGEALSFGKKGCRLGDGDSCNEVGVLIANGNADPKKEGPALAWFEKACDAHYQLGCTNAVARQFDKKDADYAKLRKIVEPGCQQGVEYNCMFVGMADFKLKNYADALGPLRKYCDSPTGKLNKQVACRFAGLILINGLGKVHKQPTEGLKYVEKSCTLKGAQGCAVIGEVYQKGIGVPRNMAKAKEYYGTACKLGDKSSCPKAR